MSNTVCEEGSVLCSLLVCQGTKESMVQKRQKEWNNQKDSSHFTWEGNISRSYHFSLAWLHSAGHWQANP
eukprot:1167322-Ditylum_brightwellii.AAC.1